MSLSFGKDILFMRLRSCLLNRWHLLTDPAALVTSSTGDRRLSWLLLPCGGPLCTGSLWPPALPPAQLSLLFPSWCCPYHDHFVDLCFLFQVDPSPEEKVSEGRDPAHLNLHSAPGPVRGRGSTASLNGGWKHPRCPLEGQGFRSVGAALSQR